MKLAVTATKKVAGTILGVLLLGCTSDIEPERPGAATQELRWHRCAAPASLHMCVDHSDAPNRRCERYCSGIGAHCDLVTHRVVSASPFCDTGLASVRCECSFWNHRDEPTCIDDGDYCGTSSECCSSTCDEGMCRSGGFAGEGC